MQEHVNKGLRLEKTPKEPKEKTMEHLQTTCCQMPILTSRIYFILKFYYLIDI